MALPCDLRARSSTSWSESYEVDTSDHEDHTVCLLGMPLYPSSIYRRDSIYTVRLLLTLTKSISRFVFLYGSSAVSCLQWSAREGFLSSLYRSTVSLLKEVRRSFPCGFLKTCHHVTDQNTTLEGLGTVTVWVTPDSWAGKNERAEEWSKVYEGDHEASPDAFVKLSFADPVIVPGGQAIGM